MEKISVAIITRNRANLLKNCLMSLADQTQRAYEVIVVDNNSTDNTKKVCEKFHKKINLRYVLEERIGIPFARNKSIEWAKYKIIAFIDDDCIANRNWLEKIAEHFKKNKSSVGVVGRIKNKVPENIPSVVEHLYYRRWLVGNLKQIKKSEILKNSLPIDFKNSAFRTDFIKKHKFSEKTPFGDVGDEDIELGDRLFKTKQNIFYDPEIVVRHQYSTSLTRLLIRNFWNGYSNEILKRKFHIDTKSERSDASIFKLFFHYKDYLGLISQFVLFILLLIYPILSKLGRLLAKINRNGKPPIRK